MTVALVAMVAPAYGAPTATAVSTSATFNKQVKTKQAQIDAYNTQLDALGNQVDMASEAYDKASIDLTETTNKVQTAQVDVANARAALALQSEILNRRVESIYRNGSLSTFEILLESKSVSDFIGRVKYINTIGLNDANMAGGLKAQKDGLEQQLAQLQTNQAAAQELAFELKARKDEVELRIADIEKLQKSAQSDMLTLLNQEATRRQSQQSTLVNSVLSGTNKDGIVATAGSPVETALAYIGIPYVWGGATPSGFDCSGLVMYVFAQQGVTLPHYSGYQFLQGTKIPLSQIQPNDVVFFGSPVHHVGLYAGGGYFIEAPHTGAFVRISKLATRSDIAGVRRFAWQTRTAPILGARTSTNAALNSVP
jgi:cell wall-associated NlpC family hydrolase